MYKLKLNFSSNIHNLDKDNLIQKAMLISRATVGYFT